MKERLTKRTKGLKDEECVDLLTPQGWYTSSSGGELTKKALKRLADYEDIGTVEEFLQLKTKQDIIHSLKNQDGKCDMSVSGETFEFMLYGLMEALRVNEADNFLALTLGNDKNKYSVVIQKCDGKTPAEMLAEKSIEIEKLTTQLENSVPLPCKVGDTVYAIAKCSDVTRKLDGTYYSSDGSPGTATGWYCAFDGKEDNCPLCGEDNCNEKDYAIFETEVLGMSYSESDEDKGWHIYLENLDTYESYHSTKPEAEARLKELSKEN